MEHLDIGIVLFVDDRARAVEFYCRVLSLFEERGGALYLRALPTFYLMLHPAEDDVERSLVGRQAGDQLFMQIEAKDFDAIYQRLREAGVRFAALPSSHRAFQMFTIYDPFGNKVRIVEDWATRFQLENPL